MGSVSDEEWAKFEDVMNDTKKSIDENENAEKVVSDEVEPSGPISFGSKYLSDLTLVVDNQELNVHRMYLAARSDVFGAMLYGEFKESKEDRIEIKEVDLQAFIRFLQIIYTGKIDDPKEFFFSKDYHGHSESVNAYSPFRKSAYTTIFSKFWAAGAELLKIADRFNMTSFVKKFDCYSCFNLFMFSLVHSVDLASQKDFSREVYNYWVAHCKRAIPETVPLAVISHLINKEWQ